MHFVLICKFSPNRRSCCSGKHLVYFEDYSCYWFSSSVLWFYNDPPFPFLAWVLRLSLTLTYFKQWSSMSLSWNFTGQFTHLILLHSLNLESAQVPSPSNTTFEKMDKQQVHTHTLTHTAYDPFLPWAQTQHYAQHSFSTGVPIGIPTDRQHPSTATKPPRAAPIWPCTHLRLFYFWWLSVLVTMRL